VRQKPGVSRAFSVFKQLVHHARAGLISTLSRSITGMVSLPCGLQEIAVPQPETATSRIHYKSREFGGYPEKTIAKNVD
jgi:hypothetical protein